MQNSANWEPFSDDEMVAYFVISFASAVAQMEHDLCLLCEGAVVRVLCFAQSCYYWCFLRIAVVQIGFVYLATCWLSV